MIFSTQSDPPVHLLAGFARFLPEKTPELVLQAPGRALWAAVIRRTDDYFSMSSVEFDSRAAFSYQSAKVRRTVMRRPLPSWVRYGAGMLMLLSNEGLDASGFDAVVAGSENDDARYEYAVGLAFAAVYHTLSSTPYTEDKLVDLAERVRREYVQAL